MLLNASASPKIISGSINQRLDNDEIAPPPYAKTFEIGTYTP